MAYTPIGWQTGDTITAEKMNKMDNGWGVENTQLFSETVTTEDTGRDYRAQLTYSTPITASTITVVFDETTYTCPRIDAFDNVFYGGFDNGPDFTTYPFFVMASPNGTNNLITETEGTHTISASGVSIVVSDNFSSAVNQCIDPVDVSTLPLLCESGVTTKMEMNEAVYYGRMIYFYYKKDYTNKLCIITDMFASPMAILPSVAYVTATFDSDEDETFIVTVT